MSDWDKDIPAWYTIELARPVRRFGLYNGTHLTNETVVFPIGCTLVTGPPVWKPYFDGCKHITKLMLPILSFTQCAAEDKDRIIDIDCAVPTYGPVADFDKDIREAARLIALKKLPVRSNT